MKFAMITGTRIMVYKKYERHIPVCLECGDRIRYGRADKKFCCDECKNRHHNHKSRSGRFIKRKVLSILEKNYEILERYVKAGEGSVLLS